MAYRMEGLAPEAFAGLFSMNEGELAAHRAVRVVADGPGFPCRVSLADAAAGEALILVNHVSNDVDGPFRTTYGIYVREGAETGAFEDEAPVYLDARTLSLRGFDKAGMLRGGLLAMPGEADARIRELFAAPGIATIHAHSATYGCFLARIERN